MKTDIRQRIKIFLNSKNITNRTLANLIGVSEKTLNNKLNGIRGLDLDTIESVILHFEELSPGWLLTGKGEMLKSADLLSNSSAIVHGDASGSVVGNGVLHNGNVNGDGNIVGIVPADIERQLVRAKAEIDVLKKRIKEIETHHKKEKEVLNKMLDQAVLDKERAMSMLEKALNK